MPRHRPEIDPLETRQLMAIIIDIDTGIQPDIPLANVISFPYDFGTNTPGQPGAEINHAALMAARFDAGEAASGRSDTLISEKASDSGLFYPAAIDAAMTFDAEVLVPALRAEHPGVSIVVACPFAGPQLLVPDYRLILDGELRLLAAGVPVAAAAGDDGVDNDYGPYWPEQGALLGATNVVGAAASVVPGDYSPNPVGSLQAWSDYGPGSVDVAVRADYGTSEAAILLSIALASEMDANPRPAGVDGPTYATAIARGVSAGLPPDPALAGQLRNPVEIADLAHSSPASYVPVATPVFAAAGHHAKHPHHPAPKHPHHAR